MLPPLLSIFRAKPRFTDWLKDALLTGARDQAVILRSVEMRMLFNLGCALFLLSLPIYGAAVRGTLLNDDGSILYQGRRREHIQGGMVRGFYPLFRR